MKLSGNTILITGGTSGIGRSLAEALHDYGNRVIVTGRRRELLRGVTATRPGIIGIPMDVDDPASPPGVAEQVREHFPDLNVLIATNIVGTLRTIAAFLPMLKRRQDSVVLVTSSKLAFVPKAEFPTYCATKAFLHSWLQSLRHQLRNVPVQVLELLPPYVATGLTGAQQATDPRALPLDAFIGEVLRLIEAGDLSNGEILVQRALADRTADRDGRYDAAFAAANPV